MKKYLFILLLPLLVFTISCEDEKESEPDDCSGVSGGTNICACTDEEALNYDINATFDDGSCEYDITPPTVIITSPEDSSTVSDIITVTCMTSDNEGVEKVELWVNGVSTNNIDETEPYSFEWNTVAYEDSSYTITVRSYDTSGNTSDSDPITLTVYNAVLLWGNYYSVFNTDSLILSDNQLTGPIPSEIGNLINLTDLDLRGNQLTGPIPSEIGNLTNLRLLDLRGNQLTGPIPSEIENLTNLRLLDLGDNQLTGSIPSEIYNLTLLWGLKLNNNQFTGSIPSGIDTLEHLNELYLYNNQLTGPIPSEIGNMTELVNLYLSNNQLNGSIPSEIGNLENLVRFSLSNNQLTGSIPSEISNLTNLDILRLGTNQFTGLIPESICDLMNIEWSQDFSISNNQLCPPYPSCIENSVGDQDISNCN